MGSGWYPLTMVVLILTRGGFEEYRPRLAIAQDAVWLAAAVLDPTEIQALWHQGWNLTVFSHAVDAAYPASAVATIAEHHPGQAIWVEWPVGQEPAG